MGSAQLDIFGVSVLGTNAPEFETAASTTCGATVAAGSSCYLDLTFSPNIAVVHEAFLEVTDNAADSPHYIYLTGTGAADFSLTVADDSETIDAGQTASYVLTLSPLGGFNQSITFSCSGVPSRATCTPPAATSLDGANPKNVTLSITTQARSGALPAPGRSRPRPDTAPITTLYWLLAALATVAAGLMLTGKRRITWAVLPAVLGLALVLGACGGGGDGGGGGGSGTPAGTYTITVTAMAVDISKTTTLTLIVR
jgi:hypothetical protein